MIELSMTNEQAVALHQLLNLRPQLEVNTPDDAKVSLVLSLLKTSELAAVEDSLSAELDNLYRAERLVKGEEW